MRRFGRLFCFALGIGAGIIALMLVPPWLRVLIPSRVFHRLVVGFLLGLEVAYLVVVPACLIGALVMGIVVYRAPRTGTSRPRAARGLLACVSCLLVLSMAEGATAAWRAWTLRASAPTGAVFGRVKDPELPTRFAEPSGNAEFNLVVLGESSAEGYPCQQWMSIGRIVAWQLERALQDRRFRADILAHAGDTLELQHRTLAGIVRRPDAVIIYCGHNEFAARYSWSREVDYYLDQQPLPFDWPFGSMAGRISPLCGLIRQTADAHLVGVAPRPNMRRPLIESPTYSPAEYSDCLADFSHRLDVIVAYCERIGALPILVIPPANDAGYEPSRSFLPAASTRAEREAFTREFLWTRQEEDSNPTRCIDRYRELLARQPGFAETHFRLARLLERAGEWGEAYREYVAARDLDGQPIRCLTAFQHAYRNVADRHGCILIDGQQLFHTIGKHGLLDDYLFHDAMHPSVRGQIALAQAILEALHACPSFGWTEGVPLPIIDPAQCAAHFGIDATVWQSLCGRGAMFYYANIPLRYDRSERIAKQRAFSEAAQRIARGESPEAVGLPNIGFAIIDSVQRGSPGTARSH